MSNLSKLELRVGEVVRMVSFPIEAGKVLEFARAMHDDNPIYQKLEAAQESGLNGIPAPLPFSVAAVHYASGNATEIVENLGLDLSRTVHGEQRWIYHRPAVVGETLSGVTRIENVVRKQSRGGEMLLVTTVTDFSDAAGKPVISEEMLTIELPKTQ